MKKWYNTFDFEPMLWFLLSGVFIFAGHYLFETGSEGWATLVSALGGAGIARVRTSKMKETGE